MINAAVCFRIVRDDGQEDGMTRLRFDSYDAAYDELERFYGDLCCSDERIEYSIVRLEAELERQGDGLEQAPRI